MRIRAATPYDIQAVAALGIEALEIDPLPNMVISRDRVKEMATECISGASHFCWVAEDDDGKVTGAVSAYVHDCMFYERRQASVVQFYCKTPGLGIQLLRQFLVWARSRPVIKMIVVTLEGGADPRIGLMLQRLGLRQDLPVYIETR